MKHIVTDHVKGTYIISPSIMGFTLNISEAYRFNDLAEAEEFISGASIEGEDYEQLEPAISSKDFLEAVSHPSMVGYDQLEEIISGSALVEEVESTIFSVIDTLKNAISHISQLNINGETNLCKLMKTALPTSIETVEQAKAFLLDLHNNGETFHPEDNANDLHGDPFTPSEGEQLNKLMADIYNLQGNDGRHRDLAFDPCEYLLILDRNWHMLTDDQFNDSELLADIQAGKFGGDNIEYTIEGSAGSSEDYEYTLTLAQDGDIIAEYVYDRKKDAQADAKAIQQLAGIELTEM